MAATPRDLVEAIAAGVGALDGWTRSRWAPGLFGRDTDRLMHRAFAVGAPETSPDAREQRQIAAQGMWSGTVIEIEWAHRLRGDAQAGDYSEALDTEVDLVGAVMAITSQAALVQRLTRRAVPEGWVLGVARFTLPHRYSLTGLPPAP